MSLVLHVDPNSLVGLGTRAGAPIHAHFTATLLRIDRRAKEYVSGSMLKVRTGNLRSSFSPPRVIVTGGRIVGILENTASYAEALHNGSKPHEIRARNVKVLTGWTYQGSPVFTPVVHHPGTKAKPFMRQAMIDVVRGAVPPAAVSGAL